MEVLLNRQLAIPLSFILVTWAYYFREQNFMIDLRKFTPLKKPSHDARSIHKNLTQKCLYIGSLCLVQCFLSPPGFSFKAMAIALESDAKNPDSVTAVIPRDFPPHYALDETGKPVGFAIDVIEQIAQLSGLQINYLIAENWTDVVAALENDQADIIPNIGITPDRQNQLAFTSPLETIPLSIFVRQHTLNIRGKKDLAGHQVAVVKTNAAIRLLKNTPGVNLVVFEKIENALFALLAGEVDAIVYPEPVLWKKARDIRVDRRIKIVGEPLQEIKRAIAVKKDHPILLERLDRSVDDFVKTSEYQQIYIKWYGQPTSYWAGNRIVWAIGGLFLPILISIAVWGYYSRRHIHHLKKNQAALQAINQELQQEIELQKQTEVVLKEAKESADRANQAKSEFLSQMSHELRTPLNGILGYVQVLKRDRTLTNSQIEGLNIIYASGEQLLTLINQIIDLSKIEAHKIEVLPQPIHLENFIENIVGMMQMKVVDKNILFKYELQSNLPTTIEADEKLLRQILVNLLGNAVKFTDDGSVTLRVKLARNSDMQSVTNSRQNNLKTIALRFEIIDTGVGMTVEQINKIFQPFEELGNSHHLEEETGLEMAITRKLVELMGGQINLTSELNVGSTFWFEISVPTGKSIACPLNPKVKKIIGYEGKRRKILVVDDKLENRLMLMHLLESFGFEVAAAENGQQEIEKAQAIQPDLILTDLVMPVMNGFDAIAAIKKNPKIQHIPIIAVSASSLKINYQNNSIIDCQGFLLKPIQEEELLDILAENLHLTWIYEPGSEASEANGSGENISPNEAILVFPPQDEIEFLYELALLGSMQKICQRAEYLTLIDSRYISFATKVKELAQGCQEKAIVSFLEAEMNRLEN